MCSAVARPSDRMLAAEILRLENDFVEFTHSLLNEEGESLNSDKSDLSFHVLFGALRGLLRIGTKSKAALGKFCILFAL